MTMKLAVILVNYNGKQYNVACIKSLLQQQGAFEKKIIMVDNASQDDSMQVIAEQFGGDSRVEMILLDDNYGFSYANNVGIRRALAWGADHVLLLNNDTEAGESLLSELLACADRHPHSVIAPKICYSDRRDVLWSAGGEVSPVIRKVRHIGLDQKDAGQFDEERRIGFATGCCLLLPKTVIKRAGLLDEQFFLYYEDTEYCFRLQKAGIAIYYCPRGVVYHKVGAGSGGADSALCAYYIARNWLLCSRLHLGARYPLFLLYYAVNRTACCALWLLRGKKELVRATCRGIADYSRKKFGKSEYD
ncbi:MAG: glycosyltransferase family 2 protein [Bacteroidales bacterium]|nr:glycosyltransferase family 2 protein [Bacteroidales bacterium]MCM1414547.1 glycosyltransferase family 2 protein [bacterium]MCM1422597.1 glycosyltransferase family 2 protein [bacterium]